MKLVSTTTDKYALDSYESRTIGFEIKLFKDTKKYPYRLAVLHRKVCGIKVYQLRIRVYSLSLDEYLHFRRKLRRPVDVWQPSKNVLIETYHRRRR